MKKYIYIALILEGIYACKSQPSRSKSQLQDLVRITKNDLNFKITAAITQNNLSTKEVWRSEKKNYKKNNLAIKLPNSISSFTVDSSQSVNFTILTTAHYYVIPDKKAIKYICQFNSKLSTDNNTSTKLTLFGRYLNNSSELQLRTHLLLQSEVLDFKPSNSYLCDSIYLSQYKTKIEKYFLGLRHNMTYKSPKQPCTPPQRITNYAGDKNCNEWFKKHFPKGSSQVVPRCLQTEGLSQEIGFCSIVSKPKQACPLYIAPNGTILDSSRSHSYSLYTKNSTKQYSCDHYNQYYCQKIAKNKGQCEPN